MTTLAVHCSYGWGWFDASGKLLDTPNAFRLDVEPLAGSDGAWVGQMKSEPGHPLNGLWLTLSPRHQPADAHVNVMAFRVRPQDASVLQQADSGSEITGYAQISSGVD